MAQQPHAKLIIVAILAATFILAVEVTVISAAMPHIVGQIGGFAAFSWAFSIYLLAQATTMPLYGKLADVYGRKWAFGTAMVLFLVGSLACGWAWSMPALIAFRGLQGAGAAGLATAGTTIIGDITRPEERPRYFSYMSAVWGLAAIVGPLLGSAILSILSWPFVFWFNLPVGALALVLVVVHLREQPRPAREGSGTAGLRGAALLTVGLGTTFVGLGDEASTRWWVVVGLAILAYLVRSERNLEHPLLPLHLLRAPILAAAGMSALLCGVVTMTVTAFLPTYFAGVLGADASISGLSVGTMTLSWTVGTLCVSPLMAKLKYRTLALGSGSLVFTGSAVVVLGMSESANFIVIFVGSALLGAGLGISSLTFTNAVQSSAAQHFRGKATSLFYLFRMLGQALGATFFGLLLNRHIAATDSTDSDPMRALVDPDRRVLIPEVERAGLIAGLSEGLDAIFVASAGCALVLVVVAMLVPRRLRVVEASRR